MSSQMPAAPQFAKKPGVAERKQESEVDPTTNPFGGSEGMSFKLLKKGNKGKMEEKQFLVPTSTNLARRATKVDDEAVKEKEMIKARVLQYEAESADAGGNVYLDETKLQSIRNRPLTMEVLDKTFGKGNGAPYKVSSLRRPPVPGRGRGGGRLFNPGRGGAGRG